MNYMRDCKAEQNMPYYMKDSNSKPNMAYNMNYCKREMLKGALALIKEAVQGEKKDEMEYQYLINLAPTDEEKKIITSIRDDERNHRKWFKEIYKCYTGVDIGDEDYYRHKKCSNCFKYDEYNKHDKDKKDKPKSYIEGIKEALFGELGAVERYRLIMMGLPCGSCRDLVFHILTDEIKHAIKYNYILTINLCKRKTRMMRGDCDECLNIDNAYVQKEW